MLDIYDVYIGSGGGVEGKGWRGRVTVHKDGEKIIDYKHYGFD